MVADMVADMEVDIVADMEVDKVADMVANMVSHRPLFLSQFWIEAKTTLYQEIISNLQLKKQQQRELPEGSPVEGRGPGCQCTAGHLEGGFQDCKRSNN